MLLDNAIICYRSLPYLLISPEMMMDAQVIQSNYEALTQIAQRFVAQAEICQQTEAEIRSNLAHLQNGGWKGRGSASFFDEMETAVLPATGRLIAAFQQARSVTLQIKEILQQAEEEAARPFQREHPFSIDFQAAFAQGGAGAVVQAVRQQAPAQLSFFESVARDAKLHVQVLNGFPQADNRLQAANPVTRKFISKIIATAKKFEEHGTEESKILANILHEQAIVVTLFAHQIDYSNIASFHFHEMLGQEGLTTPTKGVNIGREAFYNDQGEPYPEKLAATVLHEVTHADHYTAHDHFGRHASGSKNPNTVSGKLYYVDEAEAYQTVLRNRKTLDLPPDLVNDYRERYDNHVKVFNKSIQADLNRGDFEKVRRLFDPSKK